MLVMERGEYEFLLSLMKARSVSALAEQLLPKRRSQGLTISLAKVTPILFTPLLLTSSIVSYSNGPRFTKAEESLLTAHLRLKS